MIIRPRWQWIALLLLTSAAAPATAADVTVFFSPGGGVARQIAAELDNAKSEVLVNIYSLSEPRITASLINAAKRGVTVRVIADALNTSPVQSSGPQLFKAGIEITIDRQHQLDHNKYAVIDQAEVLTGSANWTGSADSRNAENFLIIRDAAVAKQYRDNWLSHRPHCDPFVQSSGRNKRSTPPPELRSNPIHPPTPKGT